MSKPTSAKLRAKLKNDVVTVKALMTHPMETGLRKDKESGNLIPANFIQTITCESAGQPIMTGNWNATVSKNPYLSFKFKGGNKGDEFKLSWVENTGATGSATAKIK